jgi:3-oxoacyl-[acyl-carrier protein] reductase
MTLSARFTFRRSTLRRPQRDTPRPYEIRQSSRHRTGAGRGIGHAIALRSPAKEARVAVVSRTEANALRTTEEILAKHAGMAKAYAVDVADHGAVKKLAEQILGDFSRVDILVNNAGLTRDGLSMRMSPDDWDVVLDTNLKGAFNFIQAVERPMIKQRSGRIINISSVAG